MTSETFRIPAENIDALATRLIALNKRCKKIRMAPITMREIEEQRYERADHSVSILKVIEVSGETPMYDGWELAAILQGKADETGQQFNVLRQVPGVASDEELVPFRNKATWCDYCRKNRRRNDTYLLRHFEGNMQQIGSDCLHDFLPGNTDPMAIARQAEYILSAMELAASLQDPGYRGRGYRPVLDTQTYLAWVKASIEAHGWWSRARIERSGDEHVTTAWDAQRAMEQQDPDAAPTENDFVVAEQALSWIRDLDLNTIPDTYTANLYAACQGMVMDPRQAGLVASLYSAYSKAHRVERAPVERKESTFQGTVGQRQTFYGLTVLKETQRDNAWGYSYSYFMKDKDDNLFSWSSSHAALEEKEMYDLKATVKAHDDSWTGGKKTILTRCQIVKQYVKEVSA
jgi:hypothetical protein